MKTIILLILLGVACTKVSQKSNLNGLDQEALESGQLFNKFAEWKTQHSKYYFSSEEELYRFKIWCDKQKVVDAHDDQDYKIALNKFSDLTKQEFIETYLMTYRPDRTNKDAIVEDFSKEEHAQEIDWRSKKGAPPVQNQGACGSCYSFGTLVQYHSAVLIKTGKLTEFSEQQVVSCSANFGNGGCGGGMPGNVYDYIKTKSICPRSSWGYTSGKSRDAGKCDKTKEASCKGKNPAIQSIKQPVGGDCNSLAAAVSKVGPVTLAVVADNFGDYDSGIFTACPQKTTMNEINHQVALVGHKKGSYWIIQNSWGSDWGENGFMRLGWGNSCGVCLDADYAVI